MHSSGQNMATAEPTVDDLREIFLQTCGLERGQLVKVSELPHLRHLNGRVVCVTIGIPELGSSERVPLYQPGNEEKIDVVLNENGVEKMYRFPRRCAELVRQTCSTPPNSLQATAWQTMITTLWKKFEDYHHARVELGVEAGVKDYLYIPEGDLDLFAHPFVHHFVSHVETRGWVLETVVDAFLRILPVNRAAAKLALVKFLCAFDQSVRTVDETLYAAMEFVFELVSRVDLWTRDHCDEVDAFLRGVRIVGYCNEFLHSEFESSEKQPVHFVYGRVLSYIQENW